ncbi:MAG: NUDIX hydrolase [Myxococcales bacterium]|nr:NUDIX hydrolase [Myxococcales bacterium]
MSFTYKYPRPAVTVDCVVFGLDDELLKVLLIQRDREPFAGRWALPGGFVDPQETLEQAALRELAEETGVSKVYLEQLHSFGAPDRDPRDRVITVAYYALVRRLDHAPQAASDARAVGWFPASQCPPLAFDHREIVALARRRLQAKLREQPVGFELLPRKFTLSQIQRVYEAVLERALDKRNFRKKLMATGVLRELDETQQGVAHRAGRLYQFDAREYRARVKQGFHFDM